MQLRLKKQTHNNRMVKTFTIEYWELVYPCDCYENMYVDINATSEQEALNIIKNDYKYRLGKNFKVYKQ